MRQRFWGRGRRFGRRGDRRRLLAWLLVLVVALGGAFFWLDSRLQPLIQDYGANAVKWAAMRAVNDGVEGVLGGETTYDGLIHVRTDSDGKVLSVETDMSAVNRLKASVTNAVMDELKRYEVQTISLPLGNLIGGNFFTGRGPYIPIKVSMSPSVITTMQNRFESAGVNQTAHSIHLVVQMQLKAALPGMRDTMEVTTEFLVAETVLVGEVPHVYATLPKEL